MNRRKALILFFTILASRLKGQDFVTGGSLVVPNADNLRYVFEAKKLTIQIDGRTASFTAAEIADALGAVKS